MSAASGDVVSALIDHSIKPSYPRIKILEYMVNWKNHPTVDEIYSNLIKEMPTLSKTTVYNTLDLFIQNNLTRLISIEGHEARYDADISSHGHFKCIRCGRIFDFHVDIDSIQYSSLDHYTVFEKHLYFKGICPGCLD